MIRGPRTAYSHKIETATVPNAVRHCTAQIITAQAPGFTILFLSLFKNRDTLNNKKIKSFDCKGSSRQTFLCSIRSSKSNWTLIETCTYRYFKFPSLEKLTANSLDNWLLDISNSSKFSSTSIFPGTGPTNLLLLRYLQATQVSHLSHTSIFDYKTLEKCSWTCLNTMSSNSTGWIILIEWQFWRNVTGYGTKYSEIRVKIV